ncbi:hypothetical protein ACFLQ6_01470 [Thermoproteota archaeon]
MKKSKNTLPKHSSIVDEHPLLHIAWTKWKSESSEEELVKWIRSLIETCDFKMNKANQNLDKKGK